MQQIRTMVGFKQKICLLVAVSGCFLEPVNGKDKREVVALSELCV